ncbi:MAG TPA: HNH endonuclease signature motif containing protein, partial [Actinomycetota bacterium]|nr:HNH endonuclease signature motif containing protein [Actinomycetota bacterium]HEU4868909.1 HNH endonuclease signature motif containing protein [Actinomycetota bacterium]
LPETEKAFRKGQLSEQQAIEVVSAAAMDVTTQEIDHITGVKEGGPTQLYNLGLLCHYHHRLKTFHGYRLLHYNWRWIWLGPHDPPPDDDSDQLELTTFFGMKEFDLMGMG